MNAVTKQIVARLTQTANSNTLTADNLQDDNRAGYIKRLQQVFGGMKEIHPKVQQHSGDPQWFEPKRPVTPQELEHALTGIRWNHRWATGPTQFDKKVKQFFNQDEIGVQIALILPQEDTGHHWFGGGNKSPVPTGTICITSWLSY